MDSSEQAPQSHRRPCPVCHESIAQNAARCFHCGEFVGKNRRIKSMVAQTVAYIGMGTALLSTFYALREGYFYVQKQQQAREEIRALRIVASEFEQMGSLAYAEDALRQALEVRPNDVGLKQQLFMLRNRRLFSDVEFEEYLNDQQVKAVSELIISGHRLLQEGLADKDKAHTALAVAQLLQLDGSWQDKLAPQRHFELALRLVPTFTEARFRYGLWLIDSEIDIERGESLLQQASTEAPDDPLYAYYLGKHYAESQQYYKAYEQYQAALASKDDSHTLTRIRASNLSFTRLRQLIVEVTNEQPIDGDNFIGMPLEQRKAWVSQLLMRFPSDRNINRIATDLYLYSKDLAAAQASISRLVSQQMLSNPISASSVEDMRRYLAVLEARNEEQELQSQLRARLDAYVASLSWEEYLHWGIKGRHRYKVGLRVDKQLHQSGLKVLHVYSEFPFQKAGLMKGDILLSVGHQPITSLTEVMLIMDQFNPGSELPLAILRNQQQTALVLIVE